MYAFLQCMSRSLDLNAPIRISDAYTFHILILLSILDLREVLRVEEHFVPSYTMRYWYFSSKLSILLFFLIKWTLNPSILNIYIYFYFLLSIIRLDTLIFVRSVVSQLVTYGPVLLQKKRMIIYYIATQKSKRLHIMISYAAGQSFFLLLLCLCVDISWASVYITLRIWEYYFPSFIFFDVKN
jgi:hypothetical protein